MVALVDGLIVPAAIGRSADSGPPVGMLRPLLSKLLEPAVPTVPAPTEGPS
jgi:hypothetical protein